MAIGFDADTQKKLCRPALVSAASIFVTTVTLCWLALSAVIDRAYAEYGNFGWLSLIALLVTVSGALTYCLRRDLPRERDDGRDWPRHALCMIWLLLPVLFLPIWLVFTAVATTLGAGVFSFLDLLLTPTIPPWEMEHRPLRIAALGVLGALAAWQPALALSRMGMRMVVRSIAHRWGVFLDERARPI